MLPVVITVIMSVPDSPLFMVPKSMLPGSMLMLMCAGVAVNSSSPELHHKAEDFAKVCMQLYAD